MGSLGKLFSELALRAADRDYPPIIHVPHALISIATYRQWRSAEGEKHQWLYDLVLSFFSHSQGGGVASVTVLDNKNPVSAGVRWDYIHYHLLAYLISYWSPKDIVYKMLQRHRNPFRLTCVAFDTLDAITTLCALVDKGLKVHPHNQVLPAITGIVLFNSGSLFRWLDQRCRGKPAKTFLAEPGSGVTRGIILALIYRYFGHSFMQGKHRNTALVTLSLLVTVLGVLEESFNFDAFAHAHYPVHSLLRAVCHRLELGPK